MQFCRLPSLSYARSLTTVVIFVLLVLQRLAAHACIPDGFRPRLIGKVKGCLLQDGMLGEAGAGGEGDAPELALGAKKKKKKKSRVSCLRSLKDQSNQCFTAACHSI